MDYQGIPFQQIIANRPFESYPEDIKHELELLTINKDNYTIIGSASYKIQKYPSDLDLHEVIELCCNEDNVVNFFVRELKKIVKKVISKRTHYFIELKCGIDNRFFISPGEYNNGYFKLDPDFFNHIKRLFNSGLISNEEAKLINNIKNMNNPGKLEYEQLLKLLRDHYVIRWNAQEVIKGFKILPGKIKITLDECVRQKSQINIEIISLINGKFTDLSNFFILSYTDKDGNIYQINLPQESYTNFQEFLTDGLKSSIEKLWFSNLDYNPFKMIKRMWSLARITRDQNLIDKLLPIISSNISLASQIKSYLGTMIKVIEKVKSPPYISIIKELENMKTEITNILQIDNNEEISIDEQIDYIMKNYKKLTKFGITDILNNIKNKLEELVNLETIDYLKSVGLAPPPNYLLPDSNKRLFS